MSQSRLIVSKKAQSLLPEAACTQVGVSDTILSNEFGIPATPLSFVDIRI
jgi:hypothetical protein